MSRIFAPLCQVPENIHTHSTEGYLGEQGWRSGENARLPPVSSGFDSWIPGLFLESPGEFRARKAIFKSSVSKIGEVYMLETSYMKGTSLHL